MKFLEPSLKVAIAFKFANINNYEQSILILNNVLNENDRNPDANRLLAQIYESQGDFNSSIKVREKIKIFDPWNLNNIYNLGVDYSRIGQIQKAQENMKFVAESKTNFPEVQDAMNNLIKIQKN